MTILNSRLWIGCILVSKSVYASQCQYEPNFTPHHNSLSLGDVIIPHRLPAGSVIKEITLNEIEQYPPMVSCPTPTSAQWDNSLFPLLSEQHHATHQTNIDGIGIRFIPQEHTFSHAKLPFINHSPYFCDNTSYRYRYCGNAFRGIRVQLIKTKSSTGSGELDSHQLIAASIGNLIVQSYRFLNTRIITPSCELQEKHKRVKMNKVKQSQFRGVGSHSSPIPFYLTLNCNGATAVGAIFSGRSAGYFDDSVIALDNRSDSAEGIGLQILFEGQAIPLNKPFHLGTSFDKSPYAVYFSAQYTQTQPHIRAGKANATATLQIIYP